MLLTSFVVSIVARGHTSDAKEAPQASKCNADPTLTNCVDLKMHHINILSDMYTPNTYQ